MSPTKPTPKAKPKPTAPRAKHVSRAKQHRGADQHSAAPKDEQHSSHHLIGYARVSSLSQDTATQQAKLTAAGCTIMRTEKASGASRNGRDELASIMEFIRPGDSLVVVKLDRLGRSTRDVLNLVHELEQKGASLRVLEPAIDTGGPMGKMVLTVLGMVAEMELAFIKDRQRTGIEAAKANGVYRGRPPSFDHYRILAMRKEGRGATEIARVIGCKRGLVYKVLHEARTARRLAGLA
jgi:DNA invertase Pin-like site-specific DNA recombinase